jgi:hypothetical protein
MDVGVNAQERAAIRDIRGYASANRIEYAPHALLRMRQRNIGRVDVQTALTAARICVAQPNGRYKVTGPDFDGDDLDLVVIIKDGVLVVTLF